MSLRRIRLGEFCALIGACCVVLSLLLPCYENTFGNLSAWQTFGPAVALLILAGAAALFLVISTLSERSTALPVAASVWCTLFGFIGSISALIRVLERPHHATALCVGTWLALAGGLFILLGAWQSMRDERTSAYEPPDVSPRQRSL